MQAENMNFTEKGVEEAMRKNIMLLWNVYSFYEMYATNVVASEKSEHVLDQWIVAKLNALIATVTKAMNEYNLPRSQRAISEFIDELSTWYLRRSRDRFKEENNDKQRALATMKYVLENLSKVMAPFTPFIAEKIYREMGGEKESVHLEDWPEINQKFENEEVLVEMAVARKIVEVGLAMRAEAGVKIRQPLRTIYTDKLSFTDGFAEVVADELNVKNIKTGRGDGLAKEVFINNILPVSTIIIDTTITPELKKEGLLREVVRTINQIRKDQKLTISDRVSVHFYTQDELLKSVFVEYVDEIKKSVLAETVVEGSGGEKKEIDGITVSILIEKK
jgi:isoleucyl-tRNA synthetase